MDSKTLKEKFKNLAPLPSDSTDFWTLKRQAIRNHVANDDLAHFLEWSTIQATMYVGFGPYYEIELAYVKAHFPYGEWLDLAWADPYGFSDPKSLVDPNLIHQAYHIARWEKATGLNILDMDSVYEYGGGYGAFPLVLHRLGIEPSCYYGYDLPEVAFLRSHYLDKVAGIITTESEYPFTQPFDLFVAIRSLNETPEQEQIDFLSGLNAKYMLVNCTENCRTVDLLINDHRWDWVIEETDHIPGGIYMFGVPR